MLAPGFVRPDAIVIRSAWIRPVCRDREPSLFVTSGVSERDKVLVLANASVLCIASAR